MMALRQIVNRIAKEKKVSVASLARSLGMSSQNFDSYLNGNPRMDNLMKIAKALDVDPKELMVEDHSQLNENEISQVNDGGEEYLTSHQLIDKLTSENDELKKENERLTETVELQRHRIKALEGLV